MGSGVVVLFYRYYTLVGERGILYVRWAFSQVVHGLQEIICHVCYVPIDLISQVYTMFEMSELARIEAETLVVGIYVYVRKKLRGEE